MILKKNKRIGKVLFIVEGGKHEFNLLKKVFEDILGYERIEKRRDNPKYYKSKTDNHSVIAIINTKTSNIMSLEDDKEYLEEIYINLIEKYDFNVNNASIYYLFDRDVKSNTNPKLIKKLLSRLKNSKENDDNMQGGILLFSYPAIESYEISNFVDSTYNICYELGREIKEFLKNNAKEYNLNKICENSLLHAVNEMLAYFEYKHIPFDIDNMEKSNIAVFDKQEQHYQTKNTYQLLSMLSYALLDLGIIESR